MEFMIDQKGRHLIHSIGVLAPDIKAQGTLIESDS